MITGKIIAKDLLLLVSCTYYPTDKNMNKEKGQKRKPNQDKRLIWFCPNLVGGCRSLFLFLCLLSKVDHNFEAYIEKEENTKTKESGKGQSCPEIQAELGDPHVADQ